MATDVTARAVGRRLVEAREDRNMSQTALAEVLGVTRSAVSQWESGLTTPSAKSLRHAAVHLEVSVDWLASGRGNKRSTEARTSNGDGYLVEPTEAPEPVRVAAKNLKNAEVWQITADSLDAIGYTLGSYLVVDLARAPRVEDAVLALCTENNQQVPVIRQYVPPYLIKLQRAPFDTHPLYVDNRNVIIRGVVVSRFFESPDIVPQQQQQVPPRPRR